MSISESTLAYFQILGLGLRNFFIIHITVSTGNNLLLHSLLKVWLRILGSIL